LHVSPLSRVKLLVVGEGASGDRYSVIGFWLCPAYPLPQFDVLLSIMVGNKLNRALLYKLMINFIS
jgi:hypothetical protein